MITIKEKILAHPVIKRIWDLLQPPPQPKIELHRESLEQSPYTAYLTGWVARDKSGKLQLFSAQPMRFKIFGEWSQGLANIDSKHFPDLKWEDGAMEVTIILKNSIEKID